jgi:hypothetical protein
MRSKYNGGFDTGSLKREQGAHNPGLAIFTFGNVSAIDRLKNRVAIKPSGVTYETLCFLPLLL